MQTHRQLLWSLSLVFAAAALEACDAGTISVTPAGQDSTDLVAGGVIDAAGAAAGDAAGSTPADLSMAMAEPPDLAVSLDLTPPPDLTPLPDLAPPPDFVPPPDLVVIPDLAVAHIMPGALVLNEVHASNLAGAIDEDGDQEDWIELYNTTNAPLDLTGVGLSNKAGSPYKWTLPDGAAIGPKAYLTVWASKKDRRVWGRPLHTSFNFNNGSDAAWLTSPGNVTLDNTTPPRTKPNVSWCRIPDAVGPFQHCTAPTPGAANMGVAWPVMLDPPSFSVAGGFYLNDQMVALSASEPGAIVRYTLDGSDPTANSMAYMAPIAVTNTNMPGRTYQGVVIRAASFANGALSSPINSHTYFVDANGANTRYPTGTINALNVDPAKWAALTGNAEAQASLELYQPDGRNSLRAELGVQISGNYSRSFAQQSHDVIFRDGYGVANVPNPGLFPNRTYPSLKRYRLRNTGNDWSNAHIRDAFSNILVKDSQVGYLDFSPAVVFLNGKYWGYVETREKPENDYLQSAYGADSDTVDLVVYDYTGLRARDGTLVNYNTLLQYVANHPMTVQSNYDVVKSIVDVENLVQYWNTEMFIDNGDWPTNNMRLWRDHTDQAADAKWRWVLFDLDFAFSGVGGPNDNRYSSIGAGPIGTLVASLLKNSEFRTLFINANADMMNGYFTQAAMTNTLNAMVGQLMPLMQEHLVRWNLNGGSVNTWLNGPVKAIRDFIAAREPIFVTQTQTYFTLGNAPRYTITLDVNDTTMGNIKINTLDLKKQLTANAHPWTGKYYPNIPITVTANPAPGYRFVQWSGADNSASPTIKLMLAANATLTATFAVDPNYMPPPKPQPAPPPPPGVRDLALGGVATQSSTAGAAVASLAIDGDLLGNSATGGSVAITNTDANAWWQVDLGQSADLYQVQLHGRTDASLDRLADLQVFVSDKDMAGRSYANLLADNTVFHYAVPGVVFTQLTVPLGRKGRYVRVQLAGSGVMQLAEVVVLGTPVMTVAPDLSRLRNVALGKMATQSSTAGMATAVLAIDGNPDGTLARRSVTQTTLEATPYWEVDLGASTPLQGLTLYNRTDCCKAALANFTVYVSEAPMAGKKLTDLDADPAVWKLNVTDPVSTFAKLILETRGRYLRVQLRGAMAQLSLAEVVVQGLPQ